ncbi:MAG: family 43 glycosylhydrolase [Mangrovibacterium sp.]
MKVKNCLFLVFFHLIPGCLLSLPAAGQGRYTAIHSGISWFDQNHNEVNAHGACIVKEGDKYYLFGEYKTDSANLFIGFSCYSSTDLMNWKFERKVLAKQTDGLLGPNRIGERVKVMKCPETGEFVMYMHTDDRKYNDPHIGYATCKTIDGDYRFQGALLYGGEPIRRWDMGTFQDSNGKGYLLIHHGVIYELSSDYKSAERLVASGQASGESPAMFKNKGVYYWLSSNLTSWERNDNFYLTAASLEGPWTKRGLFAPEGSLTWNSQCSFVLPVTNQHDTLFVYVGDRWSFPKQGSAATQVWLPISLKDNSFSIPEFIDKWRVDFPEAKWSPVAFVKESIKEKIRDRKGNWQVEAGLTTANEQGALLTYSYKGRQVGIQGVSNNTSGYARIAIKDGDNREIINTVVDFYSKYEDESLKFVSPRMKKDNYTMTIEVLGEHGTWSDKRKNVFGSTDNFVRVADVFTIK